MDIPAERLKRQLLSRPPSGRVDEVVAWFGAMQAQDYLAALWALGIRTRSAGVPSIEAALASGSVIRTHVFRFTWQFVAADDLRWMLGLVGSRVIGLSGFHFNQLELDAKLLKRCGDLFTKALAGGKHLTRAEMGEVLTRGRVPSIEGRLAQILGHAELDGVICSGARKGKQSTFALLEERVPRSAVIDRDEALERIALRYFQSRGPATDRDLSWWTGLTLGDCRRAIDIAGTQLKKLVLEGQNYWSIGGRLASSRLSSTLLLPAFDEYLVGYKDRSAVCDVKNLGTINTGGGILHPTAVLDGRVVGIWRRVLEKGAVTIDIKPFQPLSSDQRDRLTEATKRYGKFLRLESRLNFKRKA